MAGITTTLPEKCLQHLALPRASNIDLISDLQVVKGDGFQATVLNLAKVLGVNRGLDCQRISVAGLYCKLGCIGIHGDDHSATRTGLS